MLNQVSFQDKFCLIPDADEFLDSLWTNNRHCSPLEIVLKLIG